MTEQLSRPGKNSDLAPKGAKTAGTSVGASVAEAALLPALDLARYPLDRPHSEAWHALVARAQAELAANGMFNLDGLVKTAALDSCLDAIAPLLRDHAFTHKRNHNIYFKDDIPGLSPDHPALTRFETVNHTLCADQLAGTLLVALYHWAPLRVFLAAVMEKDALYVMGDALAPVNVMEYHAGEGLNWHFDRSEFTTTLLLQAPEGGGEFVYRQNLRSEDDPNYDGVAELLAGRDGDMRAIRSEPGTLNVFRGKYAAHRVTPVEGDVPRRIAVFSFFETPDVVFSDKERIGFYGRAG